MKKLKLTHSNSITINEIIGFFKKHVTKFGTGAKVDCPKEYIGKEVYLVIKK